MKSGNSAMVRQINREVIRNALKACEFANIAELSRTTGLSPATCANIIPELVADGEVLELDERQSRGGRPARLYAYNPNHSLVAAILLRYGDGIVCTIHHSVRNSAGVVLDEGRTEPAVFRIETLDGVLDDLTSRFPNIKAVAVSVPGIVHNGEVEYCDIPELSGVNLEGHLHERHSLATVTENDMNFAAVGYQNRHPETINSGLAYMYPDLSCPGCGIMVGGVLVKGKSSFAGEIANIPFMGKKTRNLDSRSENAIEVIARLCIAVIAVVNPGAIVMTGHVVREDMHDAIRAYCLEFIPEQHMPELIVKLNYEEDCFEGMVAMALQSLSCDVRLVERKRSWSGD